MHWLERSQAWLQQRQSYELGKEQIAVQREGIRAQYAVGMASVQAQKDVARIHASVARAQLGFQQERFEWEKQQAELDREDRRAGMVMDYLGSLG